jgi:uncharacterized protein
MTESVSGQRRSVARTDRRLFLWLIGLLIVLLPLHAFWLEPASLRLAFYGVAAPANLRAFGPLRIAVIADLHAGAPFIDADKIDRVVALTREAKPDLILLLGDYVVQGVIGGQPMPIEEIAAHLRPLSAPLGVYAVLGNHDRYGGAGGHIASVLEANGIPVLEDRAVKIGRDGRAFYLVGISDYSSGPHDVIGALSQVPTGESALCFTHSPDVFPELPAKCPLTIAGHTHGGQVWFPIVGRMIVPSKYGQRYATGLISEGGKEMFVGNGIGTSIIPVRFHVPPEVSVLEIR